MLPPATQAEVPAISTPFENFKEWKQSGAFESLIGTWDATLPNEEYHHGNLYKYILSSSGLKLIKAQTPMHWICKAEEEPEEPTGAMRFGSAFHSIALGFESEVVKEPEGINKRTKVGKAEYAAFKAESEGKVIVTAEERDKIDKMVDSAYRHPSARALLEDAENDYEHSGFFRYPGHSFPCRIRPDVKNDLRECMADLKTCIDASPEAFGKSIANYGYHYQGFHYISGMMELTGQPYSFYFIAVEKSPPYAVAVYYISNAIYALANEHCAPVLEYFEWCFKHEAFPAYDHRALEADLPGWAFR